MARLARQRRNTMAHASPWAAADVQLRLDREAAAGLLAFDQNLSAPLPKWRIHWVENPLRTCNMWSYYCDLKEAMGRLHHIDNGRAPERADLIVVGPKLSVGFLRESDGIGFSRRATANVPIALFQNKMYRMHDPPEFTGDLAQKLRWAGAAGVAAAFTWIGTRHIEFTERSGVPHHWLPFGVDARLYGQFEALAQPQPFDVGFSGAADRKYPMRGRILEALVSMNVSSFVGTWSFSSQVAAARDACTGGSTARAHAPKRKAAAAACAGGSVHWQKHPLGRKEYAQQIARTKLWVSTTGPEHIVGSRYFEVLASGTTLLLCNRLAQRRAGTAYDGLFVDGVHVVMFDGVADMRVQIERYLRDDAARRRIVAAAAALARRIHTWDARAHFVTKTPRFELATS